MLGVSILFATSWAFSILLGSFGVFFIYISFLKPDVGADAIILLLSATALVWAREPNRERSSKGKALRP
jgi:hypothetical protein